VLGSDYEGQNCSIARTLELVGERWTILILRDVFLGTYRFDELQRDLGIARNVLQTRLARLVDEQILRRVQYQERPPRFEYRLTRKGTDLWPVLVALLNWGDRHVAPNGPPIIIRHRGCGGEIDDRRRCTSCGQDLDAWEAQATRGPGREPASAAAPVAAS
jgi:DNA-binding HxlR family transcriptional regulator